MARIFPIKEGQEVFLVPYGNLAAWNGGKPMSGHIKKIARKYIYVEWGLRWEEKICKENFCSSGARYNGGYAMYESLETIERAREIRRKKNELRKFFSGWRGNELSDDVTEKVYDLVFADDMPKE